MCSDLVRTSRLIAAAAVLGLLVAAPVSEASFPGKPGRVAFEWDQNGAGAPEPEIAAVNPDASGFGPITVNNGDQLDARPSFSADGKRILFGQFNSSVLDYQVIVANADGSGQDGLLNTLGQSLDPAFAPDGHSFAYVCNSVPDRDICAWRTDGGGGLPPLTDNAVDDADPAYARDGRLFFSRADGADLEIWVRRPGGAEQQLTSNSVDDEHPNPSPDAKRVAFSQAGDLVVMNSNGSGQVNLTASPAIQERGPSFSPTGQQIAFQRDGGIWLIGAAGGAPTPLRDLPGDFETFPDWQPIPVKCGGKTSTLVGTPGKDKLVGTSGADVIAGLGGRDNLMGKAGNDILCGGAGKDKLSAAKGKRDRCLGGKGADSGKGCEKRKSL